jgi:uncharacterized membrane protein
MLRDKNPEHWKLLFFYYNPDQPRLWVAKRFGSPITLNFAKPMAWVITGAIVGVPVVASLVTMAVAGR